jgi:hypothetical protein
LVDGQTYDIWKPTTARILAVANILAVAVSHVGFGGHLAIIHISQLLVAKAWLTARSLEALHLTGRQESALEALHLSGHQPSKAGPAFLDFNDLPNKQAKETKWGSNRRPHRKLHPLG